MLVAAKMPGLIFLVTLVSFLVHKPLGRGLSPRFGVKPTPGFIVPFKDAHCTDYFKSDQKVGGSWAKFYDYKFHSVYPSCSNFSDVDFSGAENGNALGCQYLASLCRRLSANTDNQNRQRLLDRA